MAAVQKNQIHDLAITGMTSAGQGVGKIDGLAVFVPFALPEEEVRVRIVRVQKHFAFGRLESILLPSPARVEPRCPVFARCGGCVLQHMDYASQREQKRQVVVDALQRIGHVENAPELTAPILGMDDPWHYRNKLSLPVGLDADGGTNMGFYAARSHRIVSVEDCPLQSQSMAGLQRAIADYMSNTGVRAYDESTYGGDLRHLYMRNNSDGEAMVVAVSRRALPDTERLCSLVRNELPGLQSLQSNVNPSPGNGIWGSGFHTLYGTDRLNMSSMGLTYAVSAPSFWQVNSFQMEALYTAAMDMVPWKGHEFVVDAYCGVGSISLPLARRAKDVLGIETLPKAVEDARANAKQNAVDNVDFECGLVEEILPILCDKGRIPDVLFLDPPRKGCEQAVTDAVVKSCIPHVVYISCDPATQARDAERLAAGGYKLKRALPVDMFPQTGHVECVVLMSRISD